MADVGDHYDDHLGPIYEWMAGTFEVACAPSLDLFRELELEPNRTSIAVDLGCGHGLQAIPLAGLRFDVIAIDTCEALLEALAVHAAGMSVTTLQSDISDCWSQVPKQVDLVVCMGDTLTHLASKEDVEKLIGHATSVLTSGGVFVLSFRDYVSNPLSGDPRFIPVRSDENRILTCFLEAEGDKVRVHDLIYERSDKGWEMTVSSYHKLRLDPEWVASLLGQSGFEISMNRVERGMVTIAARVK